MSTLAPPIGALFTHNGRRYRLTSYLRPADPPPPESDWIGGILHESCGAHGPDRQRLQWCSRAEAVYVSGSGTAGCIARVTDIEVTGMVNWPAEMIADAARSAQLREGEMLF